MHIGRTKIIKPHAHFTFLSHFRALQPQIINGNKNTIGYSLQHIPWIVIAHH